LQEGSTIKIFASSCAAVEALAIGTTRIISAIVDVDAILIKRQEVPTGAALYLKES
jgi:hypothetical protein